MSKDLWTNAKVWIDGPESINAFATANVALDRPTGLVKIAHPAGVVVTHISRVVIQPQDEKLNSQGFPSI